MLQLREVGKTYEGRQVLDLLTLSVDPGQTLAVIGPSGCGKSTLIRLMIGLIAPDHGTVTYDRVSVTGKTAIEIRRRFGYVIQDGGLFPHLTALDNVALVAQYLKWPREQIAQRLQDLCRIVHLEPESLTRYPLQLSGGQKQRVSLMRALMLDPEVLLLDEPLGALDPLIRADLQTELREIFRSLKKTVVLVTHDLDEAAFLADRVLLMDQGRIVQDGTIDELLGQPANAFVTRFIRAQRPRLGELPR